MNSNLDWTRLVEEHQSNLSGGGGLGRVSSPGLGKFVPQSGTTASAAFLRGDGMQLPHSSAVGLSDRIELSSLLQAASAGAGTSAPVASTIADYAALQQRLFLEDQARRDLVAHALLRHQSQSTQEATMAELLASLGVYPNNNNNNNEGISSHPSKGLEGNKEHSSPPLKKRRINKHAASDKKNAAPIMPLSYTERKSTFPLPMKEGQGNQVKILSLSQFETAWKRLESNGLQGSDLKNKFATEFFARKITKNDPGRLYKKVHGLSNGSS
jgi:hypothetical protein